MAGDDPKLKNEDDPLLKKIDELSGDITKPKHDDETTLDFPGLQYLGCGYDIFGQFASPHSVKKLLFDFSKDQKVKAQYLDKSLPSAKMAESFASLPPEIKMLYSKPERVQFKPLFETKIEYQWQGSLEKEQKTFTVNAGLQAELGAFVAELEARYSEASSRVATKAFYSAMAIARYYVLSMANYPDPDQHADQLSLEANFKNDLNDSSVQPERLFGIYGTHYISSLTVGCRAVFAHTIDTSKVESSFDAEAHLKAKYQGVGANVGGGATGGKQLDSDVEKIKITTEGLDPTEELEPDEHGNVRPLTFLKSGWHNPVLIDLPRGEKPLTPIWALCTNAERKKELAAAFPTYAKAKGRRLIASATHDLQPLYLLQKVAGAPVYRFSQTFRSTEPGWNAVARKPWVYVFKSSRQGTVPLFQHHHKSPGSDVYRYETSSWDEYLEYVNKDWIKSSSIPLGYVYDAFKPAPDPAAAVYAFVWKDTSSGKPCVYYSTQSIDTRDNGAWRLMEHPDDDLWNPNVNLANPSPAVAAVLGLEGNVHWRSPVPPDDE